MTNKTTEEIKYLNVNELKPFEEHPFKVRIDEEMDELVESIRENGVVSPIIAMTAAVELSYLGSKEQAPVMEVIDAEATAPSIAQATKIHNFSKEGKLSPAVIESIMQEEKAPKRKVTISEDKINRYFPKSYSQEQIEETVLRLIKGWYKKRQQSHER